MTRRNGLDGVRVFVNVNELTSDRHAVESIDSLFPRRMEGRRPLGVAHPPKTLPATEIMNAIHCFTSSGNEHRALETGNADHGFLGDDVHELFFGPANG